MCVGVCFSVQTQHYMKNDSYVLESVQAVQPVDQLISAQLSQQPPTHPAELLKSGKANDLFCGVVAECDTSELDDTFMHLVRKVGLHMNN